MSRLFSKGNMYTLKLNRETWAEGDPTGFCDPVNDIDTIRLWHHLFPEDTNGASLKRVSLVEFLASAHGWKIEWED